LGKKTAMEHYDAVVLGAGGMGSAALYHLARRGAHVCAIERFGVAHDRGSSHGDTRIIRKAYLEHPDYVPLLDRGYELWDDLERECGVELFVRCGLLVAGHVDSRVMRGQARCYREYELPHELLDAEEVRHRHPALVLPEDWHAFFDPLGGFLYVEECVRQHLKWAQAHGAVLHVGEQVLSWEVEDGGVRIETDKRTLSAGKLVLANGAWAAPQLRALGVETKVLRKVLFWYDGAGIEQCGLEDLPCFFVGADEGLHTYYGFPAVGSQGLKVAEHNVVLNKEVADPLHLNRELEADDEEPVRQFVRRFFPALKARRSRYAVCMYTMTPDEHFVVDLHPEHDAVILAAGFSGHGFKFSSVMGEILADLALDGDTKQPIEFLRLSRFVSA